MPPLLDPSDRLATLFWIGLVGVVLAAAAGMLGIHDASAWRMPRALEARAEAALSASGMPGLDVRMEGQHAQLSGIVESEDALGRAQRAVLTAEGAGGAWAGGVTSVDVSGLRIGVFERPFIWSARREDRRIVLEGAVPSDAARARLMEVAGAAFPNHESIDSMRVVGGAPSASFTEVARQSIIELATLHTGQVRIVDGQIAIIGDGPSEAVDALARRYANPPAPFRARLDITMDGLDIAHPELQGLNLASGDAETCAQAFERVMERNVINFAPGSAAIDPSSRRLLDAVASVALRCDRFAIEVSGHTDNDGGRALNMELSNARAEAVASYLAGQGVARDRLRAQGYGPDRPRTSNATTAGQAANRRIEFKVSG